MFKIERQPYGLRITLDGLVYKPELQDWKKEVEAALAGQTGPYCAFFDVRSLFPLNPTAQQVAAETLIAMRKAGLQRVFTVFEEKPVQVIWDRLANWAGIAPNTRYADAKVKPNWEELGLEWLLDGVEPNR